MSQQIEVPSVGELTALAIGVGLALKLAGILAPHAVKLAGSYLTKKLEKRAVKEEKSLEATASFQEKVLDRDWKRIDKLEELLVRLQGEVDQLKDERRTLLNRCESAEKRVEQLESEKDEMRVTIDNLRARIRVLEQNGHSAKL